VIRHGTVVHRRKRRRSRAVSSPWRPPVPSGREGCPWTGSRAAGAGAEDPAQALAGPVLAVWEDADRYRVLVALARSNITTQASANASPRCTRRASRSSDGAWTRAWAWTRACSPLPCRRRRRPGSWWGSLTA